MNKDQSLAFNIVMKTLVDFSNEYEIDKPPRMIISGSAGSGKSFLIKLLQIGPPGEVNQANCTGVHAFLVDESSLIGLTTLGWMDFHCGTGLADQSWGGIPVVVFFGDNVQLPPVLDAPVYNKKSLSPASMHGVLVWQEFNTSVVLKMSFVKGTR